MINKCVILGFGKSGQAAAKILTELFATEILISDKEKIKNLPCWIKSSKKIKFEEGKHTEKILSKGVEMIIVSPGVEYNLPILKKAEKRNIPVISEIELFYRIIKYYNYDVKIVGITGTNGKTTTTLLLHYILSSANLNMQVLLGGNVGIPLCSLIEKIQHNKKNLIVAEISSAQLERIQYFKPDIGIFLNFAPDHLDRYSSLDEYFYFKQRLFSNQDETSFAVLNANLDKYIKYNKPKRLLFSTTSEVEQGAFLDKNKIIISYKGKKEILMDKDELLIKGEHNLENVLAAVCVASCIFSLEKEKVCAVLKKFLPVEHRIEYVASIGNINFINDSKATNVAATLAALKTVPAPIILLFGGKDKNEDYSKILSLQDKIKCIIVMGSAKNKIIEALTATKQLEPPILQADNIKTATRLAYEFAKKNENKEKINILLSPGCSSLDEFSSYEERGRKFKEEVYKLTY